MHYAAYSIEFNRIENLGILIEKKSELEVAAESFTDLQPQAVMHWTNPLQTVAMVWHTRESSIFNAIPHRSMLFCRICFMATPAAATPAVGLSAFDGPITLATKNLRPPVPPFSLFFWRSVSIWNRPWSQIDTAFADLTAPPPLSTQNLPPEDWPVIH